MLITSAKDNENNRWKRNAKKNKKKTNKDGKNKGETEAIKKGWELDDFVVHLS